jgi:chloramphenicol 3-O phosphotransferase
MNKGKIILLNGVSSSGKSTLVQKFCERMPDYLKISLDDVGGLIFAMRGQRRKPATSELVYHTNQGLFLKPFLFHRIINSVHEFSYNIIVDAVIDNDDVLNDFYSIFNDTKVIFVAVHCPVDELEKREKERNDRPIGLAKSQLEKFHQNINYDVEVNTFSNSADECVSKIIDCLNKYLLAVSEERLKNDNGVTYSFEEILSKDGLTLADIEAMEDVEIE